MDGYQATAKLRADSRFATLPLIAMTAHATIEERQRCLDAGMNDHVAKPIDPASLFETVGRFYKPLELRATSDASHLPPISGLDTKDGLSRVGGNHELYLKLLAQFVEEQRFVVQQIAEALATNDSALAVRIAHTLKGVAGNIGASPVQSAAGALERLIGHGATATDLDAARERLGAELDALLAALEAALVPFASARPERSTTTTSATRESSRAAGAHLTALLSQLDPGATDFLEANDGALRPLFTDGTWRIFEKLVQNYDFTEAQERLQHALHTLAPR
jgi:HPt (histidine-containing phosphotransfer) domain-containing protein